MKSRGFSQLWPIKNVTHQGQTLGGMQLSQFAHDLGEGGLTSGALGSDRLLTGRTGPHVLRVARAVLLLQQALVVLHRVLKRLHAVVGSCNKKFDQINMQIFF